MPEAPQSLQRVRLFISLHGIGLTIRKWTLRSRPHPVTTDQCLARGLQSVIARILEQSCWRPCVAVGDWQWVCTLVD